MLFPTKTASTSAVAIALLLFGGCSNEGETTFVENEPTSGSEIPDQETHPMPGEHAEAHEAAPVDPDCEGHVHFETGSAALTEEDHQTLDRMAACIERSELEELVITGHTDPEGTDEDNQQLGLRRGAAVAGYLRGVGVTEPDIEVRSEGEAGSHEVALRWSLDRRAEIDAVE